MIKVIFYLKTQKTDQNGEAPIYARITFKHQQITMTSGKTILKERWLFTNNLRNPLKIEKEKIIKNALNLFQSSIEKKFLELFRIDPIVSLELLKSEITGNSKIKTNQITILEIMHRHNNFFKRKVEAGERAAASLQKYERATELLLTFIKKNYKLEDIPSEAISSSFVYNLEEFLKYESSFKGKLGIKNNSVVKYMKMFKTACYYGMRMDLLTKNPFTVYTGRLSIKDAIFLTQSELDCIENKKFSMQRLEKVKDIFLFCCYTGYAPIDAMDLQINNLFEDSNGDLWIMTNRAKTAIRANVPVLNPTLNIINKYKNQEQHLIPQISNQKMNAYLKEIADLCDISKHLTWYVARHTFATTITLGNGVRLENVSAMMGHSNIKQTQHYAKILDINVMKDMNQLKQKYK